MQWPRFMYNDYYENWQEALRLLEKLHEARNSLTKLEALWPEVREMANIGGDE